MSRAARRAARAAAARSERDPSPPPAPVGPPASAVPAPEPNEVASMRAAPAAAIEASPADAEIAAAPSTDSPASAPSAVSIDALDARVLPIVRALAEVAREPGSAAARLERAVQILFAAYAGGDPALPGLVLDAWQCARRDKQVRLRLAWQHEQVRLALQDILAEGAVRGELRPGLDAAALAGAMVDAAEGCLLQSVTESGAVGAGEVSRALLSLARRGA